MKLYAPSAKIGFHYLCWLAVGFLCGICIYLYIPFFFRLSGTALCWIFFGIPTLWGAVLLLLRLKKSIPYRRFYGYLILAWVILLGLCCGILRTAAFDRIQERDFTAAAENYNTYTAVLLEEPALSGSEISYGAPMEIVGMEQNGAQIPIHGKVFLYYPVKDSPKFHENDTVCFRTRFTLPEGASSPGGYDNAAVLYQDGIRFSQYVHSVQRAENTVRLSGAAHQISAFGKFLKSEILKIIDKSFVLPSEESALAKAILTGDRSFFSESQLRDFQNSGLLHITAVSGMHVLFLCLLLQFLPRKLRLPTPAIYWFTIPFLLLFATIAAFTPSICRAVLMLLFLFFSRILHREPHSLTALSVSALVLTLWNPYYITGYSFLLSFFATLGLILFSGNLGTILTPKAPDFDAPRPSKIAYAVLHHSLSSVLLTVGVTLGVGFFSARFFSQISWGSLIANIFLIPLATASFIGCLLLCPVYLLCPPVGILAARYLLTPVLWIINRIASIFASPVFLIPLPSPPASFFPVYLLCLILLYFGIEQLAVHKLNDET